MTASALDAKLGPLLLRDRPLPQSVDAEKAVLSCLLQDPGATMDLVFGALKTEACFHDPRNREVFTCLRDMRQEMVKGLIDIITVTARLERTATLEKVGGEDYLNHLLNIVPTTANVERYVDCVLDAHILREMIRTCTDIVGQCYEATDDVAELINSIEERVLKIAELRSDSHPVSVRELLTEAINHLNALSEHDAAAMGLPTGFVDVDRLITGLKPGELFVLAARPSIGKTTLALNIARNIAVDAGKPVGFFSLEMNNTQVVLRLLCSEASINLKDVRDGKLTPAQWGTDIMEAGDRLRKAPIYLDDTAQISALELRQKARRMKQDHGIAVVIVDYLQLMRPAGSNKNSSREQEVAKLSGELKALAKELEVPVMVLAQLNRQAEQTGARPRLSHLRESGAIEQDADVVALLHRERDVDTQRVPVTDDETPESADVTEGVKTELIIAKHRNGETGIVSLNFLGQFTRFTNYSRYGEEDVPI